MIKEDRSIPTLLFVGTEFGLWISVDGGQHWGQYKGSEFPSVAVRDIAIQPRESDLVLATHGRGIWIIDDISPLRPLLPNDGENGGCDSGPPGRSSTSSQWRMGRKVTSLSPGLPPDRCFIDYYQHSRHIFGDLKIEIFDQDGKLVNTVPGSKHRGLNRATWSCAIKPPSVPPAAQRLFQANQGPRVLPGTYTVKMTKGDQVYSEPLQVVLDPRAKYTRQTAGAISACHEVYGMLGHMSYAVDAIKSVRDDARSRAAKLPEKDPLRAALQKFSEQVDELRSKIVATKEGGMITGEERIREHMGQLLRFDQYL